MRKILERSVKYGEVLDMIYLAKDGQISKRRVKMIQVGEASFRAYCYMRESRRTFLIDNVLALVPVTTRERVIV
ncbi:hypothetical protein OXB_2810 [Bacillus sp. OxB-1]|uniref:hypothetical protein n=1 Tax=Bacillus sp. (strain OxB-1) TaxID=98228 RepID=UPI000581D1E7|nr:hypothetical protein [Bacillus sp. OxB-1]BAQ11281.1 hypothetical protein OXB_2810 [Bacillus sp. OxB-1]